MNVMDKAKFVLTFLVATGIIMGGYFFANHVPGIKEAIDQKSDENKLGLNNPLTIDRLRQEGAKGNGLGYVPTDAQGNITRMIAQSMFLNMQKLDQSGTNPFGGLDASDPEVRAVLEETIRSVPGEIFTTAIDTSELKMTSDNSRSSKTRYVEGVSRIVETYFYTPGASQLAIQSSQELIDNLHKDCFESGASAKNAELSKVYKNVLEAYKGLTVPSSWIALHKMILGHYKALGDIYGAFSQCKEDPIRAYVGIDRLPEIYAQAPTIQKMLNEKARELGL